MSFKVPTYLYIAGAIVLGLAVAYALDFTRRRRLLERLGHAPQLARMAVSVSSTKRGIKAVLTVLGVSLVALALARPQVPGERIWKQRGIDVAVVMDFSKSMLARDVYPSRIERAKLGADALLDQIAGDRTAVVAFAGGAIHYPLTSDFEAAKILYHGLDPRDMAPGSDIGEGVLTARCLLVPELEGGAGLDPECRRTRGGGHGGDPLGAEPRKLEASDIGDRGRAIVIFTDGEDTEGAARAQVERAAKLGIEVYVVGVGTRAGSRIPEYDDQGNVVGWKQGEGSSYFTTRLDEDGLKALAKAGGGEDHYFRVDPRRFSVEGVAKGLAKLKEGNLETRSESIPSEAYQWLLFPGFMALLVEACISDRRRLRRGAVAGTKTGRVRA